MLVATSVLCRFMMSIISGKDSPPAAATSSRYSSYTRIRIAAFASFAFSSSTCSSQSPRSAPMSPFGAAPPGGAGEAQRGARLAHLHGQTDELNLLRLAHRCLLLLSA